MKKILKMQSDLRKRGDGMFFKKNCQTTEALQLLKKFISFPTLAKLKVNPAQWIGLENHRILGRQSQTTLFRKPGIHF